MFVSFLKGHKDSVLSLSSNPADLTQVASSSEDGTVRLWDVRTLKSTRCINAFKKQAVTSIAFSPTNSSDQNQIWASSENKVFCFDLRKDAIILTQADTEFEFNSEEINQIAFHPKGELLAACDDSGEVKLLDPLRKTCLRTLRNRHQNICTTVAFRPKTGHEVITGGMDCQLVHWDTAKGKPLAHAATNNPSSTSMGINPPFVHSLSINPVTADLMALGLGDADILMYSIKLRETLGRLRGHTSPVAVVHHPVFAPHTKLISAGNDKWCVLWDLSGYDEEIAQANAASAAAAKAASSKSKSKSAVSNSVSSSNSNASEERKQDIQRKFELSSSDVQSDEKSSDTSSLSSTPASGSIASDEWKCLSFSALECEAFDTKRILARWQLPAKPNALLTTMNASSVTTSPLVWVADATNSIALFELPGF